MTLRHLPELPCSLLATRHSPLSTGIQALWSFGLTLSQVGNLMFG